LWGGGEG